MSLLMTSQSHQLHKMSCLVLAVVQETSTRLTNQLRATDTPIGEPTDTSISNNNIITNNINKFSTRKRAYPALDLANPKEYNRVDTIPTRTSSRISSLNRRQDIANIKVSTHLASAISVDNPFVMLALEQIQAAIVDDRSPSEQKIVSHPPDD